MNPLKAILTALLSLPLLISSAASSPARPDPDYSASWSASATMPVSAGDGSTHPLTVLRTTKEQARWLSPVGRPYTVTRGYRPPAHKYGSGHRGIDLIGPNGDSVVAPAAGTVSFVGKVVDRHVISVRVSDSLVYSIEPVESQLQVGEVVSAGQILGTVSAFGHTQPHEIHLGVRVDGEYTNPLRFLAGRPRLLPW